MIPGHDVSIRIDFSGTPQPQQRENIRRAFDVLLDSLFELTADGGELAFNVDGAAECRLFTEKAGWIGRPTPPPQPPRQED